MDLNSLTITDEVPVGTVELGIMRLKLHRYSDVGAKDRDTYEHEVKKILQDPRLSNLVSSASRRARCYGTSVEHMPAGQLSRVTSEVVAAIAEEIRLRV